MGQAVETERSFNSEGAGTQRAMRAHVPGEGKTGGLRRCNVPSYLIDGELYPRLACLFLRLISFDIVC